MEIRTAFHKKLREVQDDVLAMVSMVEKATSRSIEALKERDLDKAHEIIADDPKINRKRFDIEEKCVQLIATQQPMASDLRTIICVLNIITEIERIGDHAVNMCESLQLLLSKAELELLPDLHRMAEVVKGMVSDALNAFVQNDIERAQATISSDNLVDVLNDQILEELLNLQSVREALAAEQDIAGAVAQLLIARSLERVADQSTNISEEVVYMVKGHDIRHQSRIGSDK